MAASERLTKSGAAFFLVVAGIVCAVGAGLFLARPDPLVQRVRQLENELSLVRREMGQIEAENAKLKAAEVSRAAAPVQRMLPAVAASETAGAAAPAGHYRLSRMEEQRLEGSYGELFASFGLNEVELTYFKQLLHDRRESLSDVTMRAVDSKLTQEERAARLRDLHRERTAVAARCDAAIRHFLNDEEDFQRYRHWEDSGTERTHVKYALPVFEAEGVPLSAEQQDRLLNLMIAEREARPAPVAGSTTEDRLRRQDAEKLRILEKAAAFLSPAQVEALKKTSIAVPR